MQKGSQQRTGEGAPFTSDILQRPRLWGFSDLRVIARQHRCGPHWLRQAFGLEFKIDSWHQSLFTPSKEREAGGGGKVALMHLCSPLAWEIQKA